MHPPSRFTARPRTLTAGLALAGLTLLSAGVPAHAQVEPGRFVDQFEASFGKFDGFRRSGAKGVCAVGEFVGSADGRALSTASAFSGKPVPVIVRFSVGGANPKAADNARSQRNLALQFNLPDGEVWQLGNISAPVFGAATPEQFFGRLQSLQPDPATKAPDPAKVKAYADANPEVLLQGRWFASQPVPASFGAVNYWGVHAFGFVNARGERQWGKWIFEPVGGTQGLSDDEAKAKGPHFLIDELRQRVAGTGVAFDFNLQLAQPGDRLDSAVVPLPEGRRKVTLGRLTIRSVAADATGECVGITFNPTLLPKGVEASADPLLVARAAPYAIGLGRRLGEGAKQ
jgi:catalase